MNLFKNTVAQYEQFCRSFFAGIDFSHVSDMSLDDFFAWYEDVVNRYQACNEPVREFIKEVRGDFNIFEDEGEDPLDAHRDYLDAYKQVHEKAYRECFIQVEVVSRLYDAYFEREEARRREKELDITVEGKDFTAIAMSDVLWCGWECDSKVWIVEDEGVKKVVTTDHGSKKFSDKDFLLSKIAEYQGAIASTQRLLNMMES